MRWRSLSLTRSTRRCSDNNNNSLNNNSNINNHLLDTNINNKDIVLIDRIEVDSIDLIGIDRIDFRAKQIDKIEDRIEIEDRLGIEVGVGTRDLRGVIPLGTRCLLPRHRDKLHRYHQHHPLLPHLLQQLVQLRLQVPPLPPLPLTKLLAPTIGILLVTRMKESSLERTTGEIENIKPSSNNNGHTISRWSRKMLLHNSPLNQS